MFLIINRLLLFFHLWEYGKYFFLRESAYSLQSPFLYHLYTSLLNYRKKNKKGNPVLEERRRALRRSKEYVQIKDMGAGSRFLSGNRRKLSSITRYSSSPLKYSLLYQFLCRSTPAHMVVELGTSVGLNTAYLAEVTKGDLYTFEGAGSLVALARNLLDGKENIHFVEGDITGNLPLVLKKGLPVDFALLDANHTYEATLAYCQMIWPYLHAESIMVIGDIHWSSGMKKAWETVKDFSGVTLSLDFFECGVLFFNPSVQRGNRILYY